MKKQENLIMLRQRQIQLGGRGLPGVRTREAIRPHLFRWMSRSWGSLDFYTTQLLMGHGSFGSFLFRIQKAISGACRFCDAIWDSAEHTLVECPRWEEEKAKLRGILGEVLNLCNIVGGILEGRDSWASFTRFANTVMRSKEITERGRGGVTWCRLPPLVCTYWMSSRCEGGGFSSRIV